MTPAAAGNERRRPSPDDVSTARDVRDWYWTRAQLDQIARRLQVSRAGNKADVAARLAATLDGLPDPTTPSSRGGGGLSAPLRRDQVVPKGQRLTSDLRRWMQAQVGAGFRFDVHMRGFFADPQGRTLADAVSLWHATRDSPATQISPQFEYNRFTRWYRGAHPTASRTELLAAWQVYKDTPVSQRAQLPE